jgi:hypothetical protein
MYWTDADAKLYLVAVLLPRVIVATMDNYFHLLLHVRTMSPTEDIFEHLGAQHLSYHADQLLQIQRYALTRQDLILKNYIYLRDAAVNGFTNVRSLQKLLRLTMSLSDHTTPAATKVYDCDFCHGAFHPAAPCPL